MVRIYDHTVDMVPRYLTMVPQDPLSYYYSTHTPRKLPLILKILAISSRSSSSSASIIRISSEDELLGLETSFDVLDSPYDAAAKNERQRGDVANFCTMELLKKVGKLLQDRIAIDRLRELVYFSYVEENSWVVIKDDDEEPSAGSNRGSKRRKTGKEPESTSDPKDKTSKSTGSSKERAKFKTRSTSKSAQAEEQVHTVKDLEEPVHQEFNTGFTED
ncbi:hypothetical protein Tco_0895666 [Tanacetum coccineum]|uniref:Uncharacterized protein n=1 Tax=Tanacetum coccineum TaxID=301880 RepID=A0ABQ5CGG0_9ASTR